MFDVEKIKSACIVLTYMTMSVFIILKNNEKETGFVLPKSAEYIFQCINGVLLFFAFNVKKIHDVITLNADDKQLLLEIKNGQEILNENLSTISTARVIQNTEPISIEGDFIRIPRNLLNHKGSVMMGDYMINIGDTSRTER